MLGESHPVLALIVRFAVAFPAVVFWYAVLCLVVG